MPDGAVEAVAAALDEHQMGADGWTEDCCAQVAIAAYRAWEAHTGHIPEHLETLVTGRDGRYATLNGRVLYRVRPSETP